MGALLVVDDSELVELLLELGDRGRRGLLAQPEFQGLVEPFDLALGLRVVRVNRPGESGPPPNPGRFSSSATLLEASLAPVP